MRLRNLALACAACAGLGFIAPPHAPMVATAQNVSASTTDERVDKLLGQMTLDEKLTLIHGTQEDPKDYQGQAGFVRGVRRLGIPGLRFADGPPGVLTRHPSQAETATMGVAATFSRKIAATASNSLQLSRAFMRNSGRNTAL